MIREFSEIARWSVAVMFIVAASTKLRSLDGFAETIRGLLGRTRPQRLLALLVVFSETATAVLIGTASAWGAWVALVMLGSFTFVLERGRRADPEFSCNCFGTGAEPVSRFDIIRNFSFMALTAVWGTAAAVFDTSKSSAPLVDVAAGVCLFGVIMHIRYLRLLSTVLAARDTGNV